MLYLSQTPTTNIILHSLFYIKKRYTYVTNKCALNRRQYWHHQTFWWKI